MKFKGDVIITDPCYIINKDNEDDWEKSEYGQDMESLGIKTYLCSDTEYGDWSCTTVRDSAKAQEVLDELNAMYFQFFSDYNNKEVWKTEENRTQMYKDYVAKRAKIEQEAGIILGHFCADSGMVAVFLLEEVLAYNPKFDYHTNNTHTTTWLKDFDGDIDITHRSQGTADEEGEEVNGVSVVGKGSVDFYTTQTGL